MSEHELSVPIEPEEWFTPKPIFDALGIDEFGLDPAHPGRGNPHCVVPARKIFTRAEDGLAQPWPPSDLIWLNPPFGARRSHVPWLVRFFDHGNGIAICTARTSSDWWHAVVVPARPLVCFPDGKTKFVKPNGEIGKEPGTGVALLAMGDVARTALLRSGLGACMTIVEPYDAGNDMWRSYDDCLAAVRDRVAAGGETWRPRENPNSWWARKRNLG